MPNFQQSLPSAKVIKSYLKALKEAGFAGDLGDQYGDRVTYQLVATGFSCRCQAKRFSNVEVQHPVFYLLKLLS